jgi:copper chaperone NosL
MRTAAILVLALSVCACSSFTPVAITAGDVCETCKKQITEVKFAGEVITPQGVVLKFRTAECLASYVREHPDAIAAKFVTDYQTGRFIRPESATYVRTVLNENTREMTYAAFSQVSEAVKFGKDRVSSPVDWLMIQRMSADKKTN